MIRRRDLIFIVLGSFSVLMYLAASPGGFPLDDAWIHQTYARNLALKGYFTYAPPYLPSAGSTSPLYTLILSIGYRLNIPYFVWTNLVGATALCLIAILGARLAESLFPDLIRHRVGLYTGLVCVLAWHLIWASVSGMETPIFCLWTLLLIKLAWDELGAEDHIAARLRRGAIFGGVGALLIATRPEGALLIGIIGLALVIARPQKTFRALLLWGCGAALGFGIAIAPYFALNYSLNHALLPNTAAAKQVEYSFLLRNGFIANFGMMLQPLLAGGQVLLIPGAIFALVLLIQRARSDRRAILFFVPIVWAFAHIALFAALLPTPYQHGRYVIPALPAFLSFSVGGLLAIAIRHWRSLWGRVFSRVLVLTTACLFAFFWWRGASIFGNDVSLIQSDMVKASQWLATNIPDDQILAVHDIGAVGYFAPRPILDIAGLVTPDIVPAIGAFVKGDANAYKPYLREHGAVYLMVLENQWYSPDADPDLCLLYNANGGMGGMRIYRIDWTHSCPR
jgi:hypothetical protein